MGEARDEGVDGRADLAEVDLAPLADGERVALEQVDRRLVEREDRGVDVRVGREVAAGPAAAAPPPPA